MACKINAILAVMPALLTACIDSGQPQTSSPVKRTTDSLSLNQVDQELRELIQRHGLKGDASIGRELPDIKSPLPQLGMKLFFSRTLSGNLDVACASCHHPLLGGGDNLSLSIGVGSDDPEIIGHERTRKSSTVETAPRNAPTTFNIGLWDSVMFHDGRIESLEKHPGKNGAGSITTPDMPYPSVDTQAGTNLVHAQARFPITSTHEMRGANFEQGGTNQSCRLAIAERLGGYGQRANELPQAEVDDWLQTFRKTFNAPDGLSNVLITEQNISLALSEYERSQVFTNTPWKHYVQGQKNAISDTAKQGALLFFRTTAQGGANCASCHQGDFFTDEKFHHTLIPPIGPGKKTVDLPKTENDYGRWLVTQIPDDKFKFRTPSLLNVEVTGPWGHNGAYTSLANVVRHMLNPFQMALHYDPGQLQQTSAKGSGQASKLREMLSCDIAIPGQDYSEDKVQALVAFLLTLTDPCVKEADCMAPWIANTTSGDPLQLLKARKGSGKRL